MILTDKELAMAKSLFLDENRIQTDSEGNAIVTKSHLTRIIGELVAMLKSTRSSLFALETNFTRPFFRKKFHADFVDAIFHEINRKNDSFE